MSAGKIYWQCTTRCGQKSANACKFIIFPENNFITFDLCCYRKGKFANIAKNFGSGPLIVLAKAKILIPLFHYTAFFSDLRKRRSELLLAKLSVYNDNSLLRRVATPTMYKGLAKKAPPLPATAPARTLRGRLTVPSPFFVKSRSSSMLKTPRRKPFWQNW